MNPDAYGATLCTREGPRRWGWGCRGRLLGHTEVGTQACLGVGGGRGHSRSKGIGVAKGEMSLGVGVIG